MNNSLEWIGAYCAPNEKLCIKIVDKLKKANKENKNNLYNYMVAIANIFEYKIEKTNRCQMEYAIYNWSSAPTNQRFVAMDNAKIAFLAGFIEGEGSLNISAKKCATAKYGLMIDPEFSITQHVNGISVFFDGMMFFQAGRIRYKSGSNATIIYRIDNRNILLHKLLNFWETHIAPYGSSIKTQRMARFKTLLELIKGGAHKDIKSLSEQILFLWDSLRMQKGQSNESFKSLEEAQLYVKNFYNYKIL